MANLGITKYGNPVLRKVAEPVTEINDEIKKIVNDMLDTLYASEGVGIAAPQIGVSKRIIIIDTNPTEASVKPLVIINPEIVEVSGEIKEQEGCLSIPDVRGEVKRYERVVVERLDLDGNKIRVEGTDLLARALQHEIDHINGKLFIDHLSKLKQQLLKNQLRKIEQGQ
ncbi:TPA: peptide deformylase [Candidatus Poribacteria bacterium]|nr:peptide deformylase [Candidatus Poribacteria bacterium]